jgi:hypothetical protein
VTEGFGTKSIIIGQIKGLLHPQRKKKSLATSIGIAKLFFLWYNLIAKKTNPRKDCTIKMRNCQETFRRYINDTEQSELDDKRVKLPNPELYVIYSGSGKKPDVVSLSEDFFAGNPDIELKVHVLSEENTTTLSGQYIGYCKVFDEQRKLHDDGVTAAKETYRICIEKGFLADYMKSHEKEVISMMQELFDEETLRKQLNIARSKRDIEQERIAVAQRMLARGKESLEEIAEDSGLTLEKVKELAAQMSSTS